MLLPLLQTLSSWGNAMRKIVLAAALFAAASSQGVSAADRQCFSAADIEAEQFDGSGACFQPIEHSQFLGFPSPCRRNDVVQHLLRDDHDADALRTGGSCLCGDRGKALADAFREYVLSRLPEGTVRQLDVRPRADGNFDVRVFVDRELNPEESEQVNRVLNRALEEFRSRAGRPG